MTTVPLTKKPSSLVDISLKVCVSHKLNIAIEQWIGKEKCFFNALKVVQNLMGKPQSIKENQKNGGSSRILALQFRLRLGGPENLQWFTFIFVSKKKSNA